MVWWVWLVGWRTRAGDHHKICFVIMPLLAGTRAPILHAIARTSTKWRKEEKRFVRVFLVDRTF
jgi:hypothetical protein